MRLVDDPVDAVDACPVVVIGSSAAAIRRSVGPVGWCVLETLVAARRPASDSVAASTRSLAGELGVSKNTVHRALVALRDAGVVDIDQSRGELGRFGRGVYRITVAADILAPCLASDVATDDAPADVETPAPVSNRIVSDLSSRSRASSRSRRPARLDQLSLLPED